MMRIKYALIILISIVSLCSFSQSKSTFNALLAPPELQENANAIVRYEKVVIDILNVDEIKVTKKRITTVYNKYGNRHVGAVQRYDTNTKIESLNAYVYNASGQEIKKIKARDFTDVSAVSDFSIYEDDRVKYFEYIPLNYPYTIEYNVEVVYNNTAFFPDWQPVYAHYLGVEHSEYQIINSADLELKIKKENFDRYNIAEHSEHHFTANFIKAINYEAYSPELSAIVPRYKVALRAFNMLGVDGVNNNWTDFGKWMYDKLLVGTDAIPEVTKEEVRQLTEGVDDTVERAKLVYKYMQDKTRYISVQVGIGGWKPMLANDVDALGYADCKGLTNYTKALLAAVDVPSYYTVVYGGENLKSIDDEFSSIQGNHVILCVPKDGENIFLECTSQTNPFGFTAGFTDDRDVLLVKPEGGEIVHTKVYEADDSLQNTTSTIQLEESGGFIADVVIETTGVQYNNHSGAGSKSVRDQKLHYKDYWDNINNLNISDIVIENDKANVVYKESIALNAINYASKSGNRLIFQANMFNKVTTIPPRYAERQLPFKIDRPFKDLDEYIIQIPKSFKIEAMAEGVAITNKFGEYYFELEEIEGNKIKYTRTYILNKGQYTKDDYQDFRDFRKKIVKHDKSKIVLVKS